MYQHQAYHHRPRQKGSYFLPFLSLIIIGLIVVLVFQIVDYFQAKRLSALENKAAVEIVTGRAEMKIWGVDQWASAADGSILNEGDAIRTVPGSRAILTLLNGSAIRLNSETEVELAELKSRDAQDEAAFILNSGEMWLKRSDDETVRAAFKVYTPHLAVNSLGTIFDVAKGDAESVRVLDGKVRVEVRVEEADSDDMRTAEVIEVAFGQELSLSTEEIFDLQNRRSVDLLTLFADDFQSSDWYTWNRNEDLTGAVGVSVEDAVQSSQNRTLGISGETQDVNVEEPAPVEVDLGLAPPVILAPMPAERTVTKDRVVITGTTSAKTAKIEVTTFVAGKAESYVLSKYAPGSESWSYVASREYANFVPGANRYRIVAIDKDGKRSDPAELTITYDKAVEPADLSAPAINDFNGEKTDGAAFETMEDVVRIAGTIGKGIVKVSVNDFILTAYVPDSKVWVYYAKTAYGNLKEGENKYEVFGIDAGGNKTPVASFTIIKSPKPAEETSEGESSGSTAGSEAQEAPL